MIPSDRSIGDPVHIQAYVVQNADNKISLEFWRGNKKKSHNHPEELSKFHEYTKKGKCDLVIYPHDVDFRLAFAGWLTSAYLMSFYAFGYRYIFQSCLNPVREYILASFEKKVDTRLDFTEDKAISVKSCGIHYLSEPEISFVTPIEDAEPYIEVSFLDFHIRLPSPYTYLLNKNLINDPEASGICLDGSEHTFHTEMCHWDMLFGQPEFWIGKDSKVIYL